MEVRLGDELAAWERRPVMLGADKQVETPPVDLDDLAATLEAGAGQLEQVRPSEVEAHPCLKAAVERIGVVWDSLYWATDGAATFAEVTGCGR